jgi:hypothetical protein
MKEFFSYIINFVKKKFSEEIKVNESNVIFIEETEDEISFSASYNKDSEKFNNLVNVVREYVHNKDEYKMISINLNRSKEWSK